MATETLIGRQEVERMVGLSRSTIYDKMRAGTFPLPLKIGAKAVRWRTSEIEEWVNSHERATGNS